MTLLLFLVGRHLKTRLNVNGELSVSPVVVCDSSHIYSLSPTHPSPTPHFGGGATSSFDGIFELYYAKTRLFTC